MGAKAEMINLSTMETRIKTEIVVIIILSASPWLLLTLLIVTTLYAM